MARLTRPTWCGLCHARCGLLLDLEDGRAVRVRGDPDHPVNRGRTCSRGRMMLEHLYHPERVNHPLRRQGERGSATWQRVSWEEAIADIATRLRGLSERHGPETLAFVRGTSRTYHWDARRFMNLFGSPNSFGANSICWCPSVPINTAMCGTLPSPDWESTQCAVIWGACRSDSSEIVDWPQMRAVKKRGGRMLVVDPRRTKEAELADLWLQIRPGTDLVLMLAWIHVICSEGLFDQDFVDSWTVGFERVRGLAEQFPASRAAEVCGLDEERIVEAARMYANCKPAVIKSGQGVEKAGPNVDGALQALTILRAITGNLDVKGGESIGGPAPPLPVITRLALEKNEALTPSQRLKQLGGQRHRLFSYEAWERGCQARQHLPAGFMDPMETCEAVVAHPHAVFTAMLTGEPYPVRALICQAANPLLSLADPRRTLAALRSLDLVVVMDYYVTPTAAMADYVLPAASTVERDDLSVYPGFCAAHPRGLDPLYERRSDYELWMQLGRRLGQDADWPWETAAEVCDVRLAPAGWTFAELVEKRALFASSPVGRTRALGFGTPSGRVELCPDVFEELGLSRLPQVEWMPADGGGDFPLTLMTGNPSSPLYNSEQRQWPTLRARIPDPLVSLHPDLAASLGVGDGDWVLVQTARASIRQRVRVTDAIHPQMVDCRHGWWFPEQPCTPEEPYGVFASNVNVAVVDAPEACGKGTGAWQHTGIPCRVQPFTASENPSP